MSFKGLWGKLNATSYSHISGSGVSMKWGRQRIVFPSLLWRNLSIPHLGVNWLTDTTAGLSFTDALVAEWEQIPAAMFLTSDGETDRESGSLHMCGVSVVLCCVRQAADDSVWLMFHHCHTEKIRRQQTETEMLSIISTLSSAPSVEYVMNCI